MEECTFPLVGDKMKNEWKTMKNNEKQWKTFQRVEAFKMESKLAIGGIKLFISLFFIIDIIV